MVNSCSLFNEDVILITYREHDNYIERNKPAQGEMSGVHKRAIHWEEKANWKDQSCSHRGWKSANRIKTHFLSNRLENNL